MQNLKKLRGKMGISQAELAKEIGISRVSINYLECGITTTSNKKTEKKLCDFFNVTPCELYGIDNLRYFPNDKEDMEKLIKTLEEEKNKRWE